MIVLVDVISEKPFSKRGGFLVLTNAPFMALTTSHIESQICHCLRLNKPVVVSQPLDRRNTFQQARVLD